MLQPTLQKFKMGARAHTHAGARTHIITNSLIRAKILFLHSVELDGVPYTESLDICRLLMQRRPTLCHSLDPIYPVTTEAIESLVAHSRVIESAGWSLLGGAWNFPKSGKTTPAARDAWEKAIGVLTESIERFGGPYLCGPSPTLADVALSPFLARFDLAARRVRDFSARAESPRLSAYLEHLESSDAWRTTFPDSSKFGEAIERYGSLDYFDYISASLAEPCPRI